MAESYAIKGLCLENKGLQGSSKFKQNDSESEMITCFERAADLGLLYLQEQDVVDVASETRCMGAILETALQRAPIVLIKAGRLLHAIERYRSMLNAVETKTTQSLRLTLARQLAEVLLRGVSGTVYAPPSKLSPAKNTPPAKKHWKPRKYTGKNLFTPSNLPEETIVLLLIAESLAARDAVLSQSTEFRLVRSHALGNAAAVYDLLTVATVRWGQCALMHESFEKALKFSFGEQHIWRQYAFSLAARGKHAEAIRALKESSKLVPHDAIQCLMSARICYEHLGLVKEGLEWSQHALSKDTARGLRPSRAQLYVGIGYQQIAASANLRSQKEHYSKLALEALDKAVQMDPNDHLSEYYLALQYAMAYNIVDALFHVRVALSLRAEHASSLHLFALLLTANRRSKEALQVIDDAVNEFPTNLHLLHVKAHMELHLQSPDHALETVQQMLGIWRDFYESQVTSINGGGTENDNERSSDTKSIFQAPHSAQSDKDSSKQLNLIKKKCVENSVRSSSQIPCMLHPWPLHV